MINRLLNRLHRVFNKDPQQYAVMNVVSSAGGTLDVDTQKIFIAHQYGSNTIYLENKTIGQIAIELNTLQYITASVLDPVLTAYLAKSLLPAISQDMASGAKLYASGSIFYNEMQVYAGQLQEQADNLADAEKQLYFHSSTDTWLDYWCKDYFGNYRQSTELDADYRNRVIAEIIRINQNNKAIELILKKIKEDIYFYILDAPNGTWDGRDYYGYFSANATFEVEELAASFLIDERFWDLMEETVNKSKSAGTCFQATHLFYNYTLDGPRIASYLTATESVTIDPIEITSVELNNAVLINGEESWLGYQYDSSTMQYASTLYESETLTIENGA